MLLQGFDALARDNMHARRMAPLRVVASRNVGLCRPVQTCLLLFPRHGERVATETHFLNVDLDIVCDESLAGLTQAFRSRNVRAINERIEAGHWLVGYEASLVDGSVESCTHFLLDAIAKLPAPMQALWGRCSKRDFNIGFECGAQPWGFESNLSVDTLRRIVAVDASVTITLYPAHWVSSANPRTTRRGNVSRRRTSTTKR